MRSSEYKAGMLMSKGKKMTYLEQKSQIIIDKLTPRFPRMSEDLNFKETGKYMLYDFDDTIALK